MPRLTRVVVLPVLRRHWALHAKRCPGAAPEKRNALERTYDTFVETAAKQWARLQDAPRHSPRDYARRTIQTLLDASRDPDEQFLVAGGPPGAHRGQVSREARRATGAAAAREARDGAQERAFVAEPGLAGHGARARAARRHANNQMADRLRVLALAGERQGEARRRVPRDGAHDADPSLDALPNALDASSAERAVAGAGAVVAHKRRWLRRNGRDLGGNDDDDLAYG